MRQALLIGIDHYSHKPLNGCVEDAKQMHNLLDRHENQDNNFNRCKLLVSSEVRIDKAMLRNHIQELFRPRCEQVLLYYSGHGTINEYGQGFLVPQAATYYNEGVSMDAIMNIANRAKYIPEVVIILDCCHAGRFGEVPDGGSIVNLRPGLTIITSSRADEPSVVKQGKSLFTKAVCDALRGAAKDVLGQVSVASIYNYADQVLDGWGRQRPQFRANLERFGSLRNCLPKVEIEILRELATMFPYEKYLFKLSPEYEPTAKPCNKRKQAVFEKLQKLNRIDLVKPKGAEHMYYAAIHSKVCMLTELGQFYWKLSFDGKI